MPNGSHRADRLQAPDASDSTVPLGFPKQSILEGLYASGTVGAPVPGDHATFPSEIDRAVACANSADPYEDNPACESTLHDLFPKFVKFKSAYYQNDFFRRLRDRRVEPVPLYSAGTFTDPLFTEIEHRRMVDRLKASVPGYPVQEFYGDYQHFTQNKAKEWADLCTGKRRRCEYSDYPDGDLNARPDGLLVHDGQGPTMRLNRFIDHYARPQGDRRQPRPDFDVTASLQICDENATDHFPADGPGPRFTAENFNALTGHRLWLEMDGAQVTTNQDPDEHAIHSDPVANSATNGSRCVVETTPAGEGVATYDSRRLPRRFTLIGQTRVSVAHTGTGSGIQINARLYDVFPDGRAVLIDRGLRVIDDHADARTFFELQGNGWRFEPGHRVRIELAQDNSPYIRASDQPSALVISAVKLGLPVRERSLRLGPPRGDRRRHRRREGASTPPVPDVSPPSPPLPLP